MASNLWVAVGNGGTGNSIVTSSDGTTWTSTGTTVIGPSAVAYKSNLWVAVGGGGNNIATSTDGVLWTGRGSTMFSGSSGKCVASGKDGSGNNLWVAGGYYSIASSPDGITWTNRSSLFAYANGIAYGKDGSGNGLWIAAGSCNPVNTIATSTNGITWTLRSAGFGWGSANAVAYGRDGLGNRLWVAVGASSTSPVDSIMSSTDGINWLYCTQCFYQGYGVAYGQDGSGNKLWVAVGYGANTIATSTNGTNWTGRGNTVFSSQGKSVTYANGLWVATGDSGNTIAISTNGINWIGKNNPLTSIGSGVVGPTKATLLTNYYFPTKKMGDASFNIIPPTSNNYGAITYTSSNTAVATIVGSKINVVGVGTSTITAVQEETFSYLSGTNTATFQVIQSTVGTETVLSDFSVPTKIIGDASFNIVVPTTNSDGAFIYTSSNIAVATIVGSTISIVGVGTSTISAIQLMTSTYATATITAPFVVNQITTVLSNFSVPTKTFGDVSFGIVAPTTNGNGSISYASSDTTVATISGDRINIVGGGSSTITATQTSTTNYTSATITAPITVNQATTVLANFSIGPKTITDASFTIPSITTNSTGLFSYTSSDPTVATIAGNVATIVGIGSATITADQASNANYLAQTISTTFSVSRNLWVAVGYGTVNTVASSYDGIVWKGLGLGGAPQSIAYSNNLWVAVGSGANTVAYSTTNGNKWTGFGKTVFSTAGYRILYDPSAALWIATGDGGNSIATSTNPKTTWIGQGSIFPSYVPVNCLYGPAIYSETQNFSAYLLGGYSTGSLLAYSLNGTTWQMGTGTSTSLACQGFNTIAYGNGVYVAGCTPTGSGNSFATSTDQISWTGRGGSTKMSNVNQIAYGNGIFIAAGTRGTAGSSIMKSTDGVTWTNLTDIGSRCVAYYQGRWFVWGLIYFYYSDDSGTTWNYSSSSSYLYSNLAKSFGFGYGVVVSVGQGTVNTLAISTDFGVSWNGKGLLLTGSGNDVKYNNGVWLAVGGDNVSTENVIVKSTNNGTTWTQVAMYNTSYFTSVNGVQNVNDTWYITGSGASYLAYSNTNNPSSMSDFTLVSTSSVYFSTNGVCLSTFNYQKPRYIVGGQGMKGSVDGFSWFDILNQPFTKVNDVYWNGTIWVGVGVCLMPVPYGSSSSVRNTIAYSYDGINWIGLGVTIFTTSGNNVYYSTANSLWIATGSGTNTMATSVDGITWTGRGTTVFTTAGGRITYDNNLLVAVGEGINKFATSTNGISWDVNASLSTGRGVAYNNGTWFIVGDGTLATSTDGIIWRDVTVTGFLNSKNSIAYGNGIWVVGGRDSYNNAGIVRSTNGTTWTSSTITGGIIGEVYKVANGKDGSGNNLWVAVGQGSIASSPDAISWTGRGVGIFNTYSCSVACGKDGSNNNFWVAVGQNTVSGNNIATSVDGITWTGRKSNSFDTGVGVAYGKDGSGNGLWVAVGRGGLNTRISTSSDGITWTGRYGGFTYYEGGYSVAYGNGLWVMVGNGANTIYTSPDGITWTVRTNVFTTGMGIDVTYANGLWVTTGYNNTGFAVATSTDGISWTLRNQIVFNVKGYDVVGPTSQVTKITTVLNNFSVPAKTVGDVSFSLVAPTSNSDGVITYTSSNIAVATIVDNVVTIVGGGTTTIRAIQASTADYTIGIISATLTVTQITTVLTDFSVPTKTFGDASFGIIAPTTSRDGVFTYSSSNIMVATIGGSLFYVAVGSGTNTIATSTNGINWTGRGSTVFTTGGFGVAYGKDVLGNDLWVAVGSGGYTIATSTDGITWTGRASPFTSSGLSIVYANSLWVATGQGGNDVAYSQDGITWRGRGNAFTSGGFGVAYGNGVWVAVGAAVNYCFCYSTDGISWNGGTYNLAITTSANGVAYGKDGSGNDLWVAVGQGGNSIATSTNGIHWTGRTGGTIFSTSGWSVAYANNLWVAVGQGGNSIATSTDGINWTGRGTTIFTTNGRGVSYVDGLWVASGTGGNSIATSTDGITWTGRGTSAFTTGGSCVIRKIVPVTSNVITVVGAGSATITAVELATPDYAAATITAPFVVNKLTTVLTNFSVPTKTFGDASFNIIPPVTNADGLITYTSSDTAVATISGTKIIIVGGGSATISANQASANNYLSNSITATFQVNPATPIIAKFDIPVKTLETAPFIIAPPTTNSNGIFSYTSSNAAVATIDGSMVTINGLGTTTITAVQSSTANFISATTSGILAVMDKVPLSIAVGQGGNTIATSTDLGLTWTGQGATTFTTSGYGVAGPATYDVSSVAVGVYISVGTFGISTSPDNGITWESRGSANFSTIINGVGYGKDGSGNNLFVIVGQSSGNNIATSTDGITWTGRGTFFDHYGVSVAYGKDGSGNGLWVGIGYGNGGINSATSSNGITWTGSTISAINIGYRVVYANNLWVALGQGTNTISTSVDGKNWIGRGSTIFTTQGNDVVYANNLWVAVGQGTNSIATSSDGITWTVRGSNILSSGWCVGYGKDGLGNGRWVVIGGDTTANTIATSSDGINWTGRTTSVIASNARGICIAYTNNLWVASIRGGSTVTSTDGVTWTGRSNPVYPNFIVYAQVTYTKPTYIAVGQGAYTIVSSTNGTKWNASLYSSPFSSAGYSVAWNGVQWVATGQGRNTIATSTDGIIWTGNSVFSTLGLYVAYGKDSSGNGLWVATGYGGNSFATSSDGVVWTGRTGLTVFTSGGCGIAFGKDGSGNALWVATGQGGNTIATSTNGTTWVGRGATVFTTQGYRVTYANNLWIAVGSGGNSIASSTNGTTWTGFGTTVFTTQGNGIRYTNNLWVASGHGGGNTIATSVDGTKWVGRGSTVFTAAGQDVLGLITAEPTLIFTIPLRNIGDAPFTIVPSTSNSTGLITYTSSNTEVATIDGSTVTIVGMGTSTITAVQESTDYFISGTTTATLTVENVKPVVTDFSVPEKTFGDAAFSIVAPTSNSDGIFTYTSSNTAVATVAGSTITIVSAGTSTITASQAITADYGSAKITATLTVNKATPTITNFSAITKTFGNAAFGLVAPTSNSTGAFTYSSSNTAVATIAGSTVTIVGGGTAIITATQATTANYLAGTTTATMTVNQATPTITNFSVPAKVTENAPFTIVNPTSNSSGAFTYTSSDTSVSTIDGSMVTIVGKGTSTITATQASTTNYLSGSIIATFIVRLTPVITNFSAITKTFGDASFSIVAPTTDSDGAFTYTSSNTAVATIVGTTITIVSPGISTITASQSLTANYVSGTITTTLTVNKATTVLSNFSAITKIFGNAAFSIVAPTSNRTGAITYTSSNTAVATIAGSTVTIVGGGTVTITATQATTTNYLAGTTTATMTVNQATPTITNFSAITKTFGNAAFSIVAPTSNSNGAFTYTSSNTAVATIAGSTVTIVGGGTATITASQATTTNYLAGTITATMTVSQTTPTITIFDVPAKAIGTAPFSLVDPTSNSSGAFTYTSSNTSVATMDGSMVTIVGLGNTTITAVQASTTNYLSGLITGILAIMVNVPLSIAVGQGGNSIATSIDRGLTWTGRTGTTVFSTSGSCVAFGKDGSGNNLLVAVGQGGNTIATSINGTTWIGRGASVFTTQGICVTYANNLWVAVGQGTNSIATSPDGVVWTGRGTSIFSNQGIGIAFNNGLWVAVGQGTNSIATSSDGITWTGRTGTSIFSNQGIGVAFNNGLWVAVGDGTNSIATSTNGTVWTGRGKTALSGWGRGVAYGNGLWVAVGQGTNSIATSPDGITWTGRTGTSIFSSQGIGVAFNSGLWIAVGQGTNSTATSPDGTVWTGRGTSIFSTSGFGVAVGIITLPAISSISPSSGAIVGGTSVTITGTNFTGATSVTFDRIVATSLNIVNSTTITCITPARSAGSVGIIVTTEDGPSGEFSSFTYITPPSITGISPLSGSTEGGTNVTITGTSFTGVTSVTFDGLAATTINVVNNTTITCITPARSVGAVGIIVTTLYGTSNTFSPFTYITPPNITSISQLTGSTAGGTNVTITGTNFTGATLVTFGGLAATTINVVNSTTITCITPARSAGAVGIIVTTGGGPSGAFVSFTYITPPNITDISPSSGGIAGGTSVTITGTNFTGATSVTFGVLSATSLSIVNSTTITCITPARSAGAVGIIVTTGGGPSDAFSSFTYISPPVITSILPLTGSTAGGTSVTITGTSFTGATLVTFSGLSATSLSVVNSTTITCITPTRGTGAAGIIVTSLYGKSGAFSSFTYITPPVISRISPSSGGIAGGTNVTITGKNFTGATLVTFDGIAATSLSIVNSTTITCITPAVDSARAAGIIVTTGGGPSAIFASSFTYISPPVISSISQLTGSTAGGTNVTITGTNFTGATLVTFDGLAAITINVVNSTTITCITPAHSEGAADIIVTTGGGSSGAFSSFTYITPPVISSISSSSGSTLGGTSVIITGTNFTGATSVTFGGLSATSLSIVDSTTISCITPARTTAGDVGIIVTTGGGPSGAFSSFTYITPPNITGISPSSGSIAGGTSVTITGTNFTGATSVTFDGIAATTINVVNSTTITCITPAHNAGAVGIIVTTEGGPSDAFSSFTYIIPPVITSISPSYGSTLGGTSVTITGTSFTGATSVTFDGIAATSLSIVDSTTITCITPARTTAGAVGIIVTTGGGPSTIFASSFTYITPASITDISPSSGINTGGTSVTITGTNFTGATSVTFGGVAATSLSIVNNTTITCITPDVESDGAVGIIVTTEGGPSSTFSSFTYITNPNITGISPSSGSIAGGTNVTITGINFTGATSVTFDGLAATNIDVVNSTTITCITPAHNAGAVGIIVTAEGGPSGEFSSFTYITPPNITGILSSSGSTLGGTSVTITGTNFTGATSVTFDGLAATTISVVDNTTITCITPAHNAGDVDIIVTTAGGPSGEFSSFTYITPPNITGILPSSGSILGGTSVTITGTSFTEATSVTFDGLAATSLSIVNNTTITCSTPSHNAGDVDIIVTTIYGTSNTFSPFTYITPPNITSISQLTGSTAGGTSVTITGTNFTGATSVTFDGLAATTINVVNNTTITCITPARTTAGAVGIIVTTDGGPSGAFSSFTYITPPNITSISPSSGSTAGGTSVTITGTNFTGATSFTFGGLAATSLSVVNSTTITCITPARTTAGAVGIIVTTGGGPSGEFSSFTYITPPNITGISPSSGSILGGTSVTITGTNFTGATSVTFDGLAATTINVVNNTTITCITPARSAGAVGIIVTTGGGPSTIFVSSFTYIAPPNITGITPLIGSTTGGTSITITGTNFTGATSVTFGGIAATSLSIVDSTTITCITPARATAGAVGVIVTTGGGPSNTFASFTYILPPNIKSMTPASVSRVGGTIVTITGTNFIGATSVTLGGLNATSFNVVNGTSITFITPERTTGGMVSVIVTTGGGPSNTFSTFIYVPFVSAILPAFGTRSGGTSIKITGIAFTGATSVTFGGIPATNVFVFNPTTITCRTPAGIAAGEVGVIVSTGDGPSNTFSSFTYLTPPNITSISPSYGGTIGGSIVIITGKCFTGVSSVLFGGLKVKSLRVIDDTTITCVTAPRTTPGPVDITVQNSIGISNTFSSYTYIITPKLTSISPIFGSTTGGNTVTIIGTDFIGATEVTVGDLSCSSFTVVDSNTLTCITPARIAPGPVGIIVTTGGGQTKKSSPFTYILPPVITSISPPFGGTTGGNVITITGLNFKGASSVIFGGLNATLVKAVNDTTITCKTPVSISAGAVDVIVRTGGGPSNTFSSFTYITPPVISDISPPDGSILGGNIVTITGTNLTGATSVLFGKAAATNITVVDDTTLTCRTPLNKAGAVGVIVRTGGGPSNTFASFTFVTPASITGILPLSGSTNGGTLVTLKGKDFTGATSVTIGGVEATSFTVVSATAITCITPARISAGGVGIIVTTAGGQSKQFSFYNYITPPVITSLSPSSGSTVGGTIVTITGTNFTGATSVTINGKAATPIKVVDNTTITCKAPVSTSAGPVDVIVTTGGGPSSAFSSFTYVTPAVITSISPAFGPKAGGTSVTITGTNFTGASNILFSLKSATNVNVVNDTTITCVTPDSTSAVAVGVTLTTGAGLSNKFSSFTYR